MWSHSTSQYESVESLHYHNWSHVLKVTEQAIEIAANSNLTFQQRQAIEVAALFHDTGYLIDPKNHEEAGAQLTMEFLGHNPHFNTEEVSEIKDLVLVTKMDGTPVTEAQKIMKDADLSHFGSIHYMKDYHNLLKELREYLNYEVFRLRLEKDDHWFHGKGMTILRSMRD